VSTGPSFFGSGMRWKNALGTFVEYDVSEKARMSFDTKLDQTTKDRLYAAEASYQVTKFGNIAAGMQMLEAPDDNSFWGPYRSNDTFYSRFAVTF
jgi:hypothetical protein